MGERLDSQIKGRTQSRFRNKHTNMSSIFLTQVQGDSMKKDVSTNGVGAIGHPYAKKCTFINSSHFTHKLAHKGSNT